MLRARTARAVLAALLLSFVVVGTGAGPAQAVTSHEIAYQCATTAFGVDYVPTTEDYPIKLTVAVPGSAENGATVRVRWSVDALPTSVPFAVTGATFSGSSVLRIAGATNPSSLVSMTTSATDPADVAPRSELPGGHDFESAYRVLTDGAGTVTFRPGPIRVDYLTSDEDLAGTYAQCDVAAADADTALATITTTGSTPDCVADETCAGEQTFVGEPDPDALTMNQVDPEASGTIEFPPVEASADPLTPTAHDVAFARVADTRTVAIGWSLTAQLDGPLTAGSGAEIAPERLTVDGLTCSPPVGASGGAAASAGDGGTLDAPVVLCSVEPGELGSTGAAGGQWDVAGDVTVHLPSFQSPGIYTGTLTLILS